MFLWDYLSELGNFTVTYEVLVIPASFVFPPPLSFSL